MGFSRQEYWSGLTCPPSRDFIDPGIEPGSAALQADSLVLSHRGSLNSMLLCPNTLTPQIYTEFVIVQTLSRFIYSLYEGILNFRVPPLEGNSVDNRFFFHFISSLFPASTETSMKCTHSLTARHRAQSLTLFFC